MSLHPDVGRALAVDEQRQRPVLQETTMRGLWGLETLRDELARRGLRIAFARGRWRLYQGGVEVASRPTAEGMRQLLLTRLRS